MLTQRNLPLDILRTFFHRTCPSCNERLYDYDPCKHCGDRNYVFRIHNEECPPNISEWSIKLSIIETDAKDDKRTYSHRAPSRSDLEIMLRKKVGRDGNLAFEVLCIDRMKKTKKHRVELMEGQQFTVVHDEIRPL